MDFYESRSFFGQTNSPFALRPDKRFTPRAVHSHEFTELVLVTEGRAVHKHGQSSYPVKKGDAFVLLPGEEHAYDIHSVFTVENVLVDPRYLAFHMGDLAASPAFHDLFSPGARRPAENIWPLRLEEPEFAFALRAITRIGDELARHETGFVVAATAYFMQFAVLLTRRHEKKRCRTPSALAQVSAVLGYMNEHFAETHSVADLAQRAHLCENQFYRVFRRMTGYTPADYLIRQRLAHASELLRRPDGNITAVAFNAGFNDSNYFCRLFRRRYGCSPQSYRKIHGEKR